jgi:2-methylcitrate dehydratase PrpD
LSARAGINAAQLGKAGWPGVKDPFFGQNGGHFPGIGSVHHVDKITGDLGKKYVVEVCFKPYPGGRPTGAPTQAALAVALKHAVNTDDVQEVVLHLSPVATAAHYATPYVIGDYPPMNALWSYYFAVASALYRKSAASENFTGEKIRDAKLQALIEKVKLGYLDKPEGIELEVIMTDGRRYSEYVRTALGDPSNPLSREGLIAKFMEQVEFSRLVKKADVEKIIELVEGLEKVKDVSTIARLAGRQR